MNVLGIYGKVFLGTAFAVTLVLSDISYSKNRICALEISCSSGGFASVQAEIADTEEARSLGLMFRSRLEKNHGMLFVFEDLNRRTFWMKNTYIPLSIAYIGKDGIINEIYDMKPLDTSAVYPSQKPAKYALEMVQGWFSDNDIIPGCRIFISSEADNQRNKQKQYQDIR